MKMRVEALGAARFDDSTVGFYVKLIGPKDALEWLRVHKGNEVEVEIKPILRFQVGDVVDYASVYGEPPTAFARKITDGPFDVCGTLCWKIEGKSGTVADRNLTPAAP